MIIRILFLEATLMLPAQAAEMHGLQFPDKIEIGKQPLLLNGLGTREATIFNVKVYVAALYLLAKSSDPVKILDSNDLKRLKMTFLRDVSSKDMGKAWQESFETNCKESCETLKPSVQQLVALMQNMDKSESMEIDFWPDRLEVNIKGVKRETLKNNGFSKLILSTWLGESPPNKSLKEGLLGH